MVPVPDAGRPPLAERARVWWAARPERVQDRLVGAMLGLPAGTVITIASLLTADPLGHGTHKQLGLGGCTILTLTGWPCPMCGMTTCFTHMAHFSLVDAARVQPFGVVLFAATVVLAVVGLGDLVWPRGRWRRLLAAAMRNEVALASGLLIGMALGWAYKVVEMGIL